MVWQLPVIHASTEKCTASQLMVATILRSPEMESTEYVDKEGFETMRKAFVDTAARELEKQLKLTYVSDAVSKAWLVFCKKSHLHLSLPQELQFVKVE